MGQLAVGNQLPFWLKLHGWLSKNPAHPTLVVGQSMPLVSGWTVWWVGGCRHMGVVAVLDTRTPTMDRGRVPS